MEQMMMKSRTILKMVLIAVILGIFASSIAAQDFEIKGSINTTKIGIDDVVIYTLTIKGDNNPRMPSLSHLKDFRVVQTSRSTQFRFDNGVSSYFTNFVYYLSPLKTGMLTIDAIHYQYNGTDHQTNPLSVEVVNGSIAPPRQQQPSGFPSSIFEDEDDFFGSQLRRQQQPQEIDVQLKAEIDRKKAVTGEPILFRIYLYSRNQVRSVNMISNQSFPGFWQEWAPMPESISPQRRDVAGKTYLVYEIRKAYLFPTATGKITIPALKFELALLEDSLSSFFANSRTINRSTQEITVDVSPLPVSATGLPVGEFTFSVTPNKNQIDINDILTLTIRIQSRKGNIKTLDVPIFSSNDDMKIFPAKTSKDSRFENDQLTGVCEAEVPVSFNKTGDISFPSLEFSYYHPQQGKLVKLTSQPFTIHVTGVKEKQESAVSIPQTEIIKKGEDIDFIKKGEIFHQGDYFYKKGLFTFLLVLFFILNLLSILKIVVFDRLIAGSVLLKKKKLLSRTLQRLKGIQNYADISPVLEEYLTEKTGMGLSSITNISIESLFVEFGVSTGDIKNFLRIKSDSELLRFAPQQQGGSDGSLSSRLHQDRDLLIDILKRIDSRLK